MTPGVDWAGEVFLNIIQSGFLQVKSAKLLNNLSENQYCFLTTFASLTFTEPLVKFFCLLHKRAVEQRNANV